MSKRKNYNTQLLATGVLVPELHYGRHAREWWVTMTGENSTDIELFPLRVGQKVAVRLNGRQFVTRVVRGYNNDINIPGYCCESQEVSGLVENSATNTVSILYQNIFHVTSKFSGSLMLGHDKESIMQELLLDIPFRPFKVEYNKHQILIHSLGTSEDLEFFGAGPGYSSSFLCFYTKTKKKQQVLIWQTISEKGCHIEIYRNNILLDQFHGKTPSTVWKNAGFLINMDGVGLFGLHDSITQNQLDKMRNLKCSPKDWKDETQMTKLYYHHLHKRTVSTIDWYSVFINWLSQSTTIELYSTLEKIYPVGHNFTEREIRAWRAMFKAAGCNPITPYSRNESQVS